MPSEPLICSLDRNHRGRRVQFIGPWTDIRPNRPLRPCRPLTHPQSPTVPTLFLGGTGSVMFTGYGKYSVGSCLKKCGEGWGNTRFCQQDGADVGTFIAFIENMRNLENDGPRLMRSERKDHDFVFPSTSVLVVVDDGATLIGQKPEGYIGIFGMYPRTGRGLPHLYDETFDADDDMDALRERIRDQMMNDFLSEQPTDEDAMGTRQNRKFCYIIEAYADLARRMNQYGNAVYVSPNCPDVLGTHEYMAKYVADIEDLMREAGVKVVQGRNHWESIRPFAPSRSGRRELPLSSFTGKATCLEGGCWLGGIGSSKG